MRRLATQGNVNIVDSSDLATREYVDSLRHKPVITIWAYRRGDLPHGNF